MNDLFDYPIKVNHILRNKKSLKEYFLKESKSLHSLKVAILGGSTTNEISDILELFLYNKGFKPQIYQSDYNKYYEDGVFSNEYLEKFQPEVVYIHTTSFNISRFPSIHDNQEKVQNLLSQELLKFKSIWDALSKFKCAVIQNNFEYLINRSLGNLDSYDFRGKTYFINLLNQEFARAAQNISYLYINDINYLSAKLGLNQWFDKKLWYTAKYALSFDAIPFLCNNITVIINSIFNKTQKCLVLDLDNTLWGGVIGDDGLNGIKLGNETALGQAYTKFQEYVYELYDRGIILAVNSKNEEETAKFGFTHSDSVLKFENFVAFYANWDSKDKNIKQISLDLDIGLDSILFIDDNAAERNLVKSQIPIVKVPEIGSNILEFIEHIQENGYFEPIYLSSDDFRRTSFYFENKERLNDKALFENYDDFLSSLNMKAEVNYFSNLYLDRITQLINKTNQFNLTTSRHTIAEVRSFIDNPSYICLYGKLTDKFGDNGLVSVIIGKIEGSVVHIISFLMSCRVLKRGFEFAILNEFVSICRQKSINKIIGYYKRTEKNKMVNFLYKELGFKKVEENDQGDSIWELKVLDYNSKVVYININK
jgi:FkbH-like protein